MTDAISKPSTAIKTLRKLYELFGRYDVVQRLLADARTNGSARRITETHVVVVNYLGHEYEVFATAFADSGDAEFARHLALSEQEDRKNGITRDIAAND